MKGTRIIQPVALSDFPSFVENEAVLGASSTAASSPSCRWRHLFSKYLEKSLLNFLGRSLGMVPHTKEAIVFVP